MPIAPNTVILTSLTQWYEQLSKWGNSHAFEVEIILAVLGVVSLWLYARFKTQLSAWYRKRQQHSTTSAIHNYLDQEPPQYYQEHRLQVPGESESAPWVERPNALPSLDYFWQEFTAEPHRAARRVYLVVGPTGIGKTTFLLNLYARYQQASSGLNAYDLVLGPLGSGYQHFYANVLKKRIEDGSCATTILLLDALDEYRYQYRGNVAGKATDAFEHEFLHRWHSFQEEVAPYFHKVVITVREQFFHTRQQQQVQVTGHQTVLLRLAPFNQASREAYLDKRYAGPKNKELNQQLKYLNTYLTERARENQQLTPVGEGRTVLEIPLLLTHLEDLWHEWMVQKQASPKVLLQSPHQLIDVLVRAWLHREETEKGLPSNQLRAFCQRLAAALVKAGPYAMLSAAELRSLEDQQLADGGSIVAAFEGRGDRSLLVRKGSFQQEDLRFEFVHEQFLGYFLAEYLDRHPEQEPELPFAEHEYAFRYVMSKRWHDRRRQHGLPAFRAVPDRPDNVVDLDVIRAWGTWFDELTRNEAAQLTFRESWRDILTAELPDWQTAPEIKALANMRVTEANLWEATDTAATTGAHYLRNFVTVLDLRDQAVSLDQLRPLFGARSLLVLAVTDPNLSADFLSHFVTRLPHLTQLGLDNINLAQAPTAVLEALRQNRRLRSLSLRETQLPADYLPVARLSHLTQLYLDGIALSKAPAAVLEALRQNQELLALSLESTGLDPAYLPLARLPYLTMLNLNDIDLSSASSEVLSALQHNEKLVELSLNNTAIDPTYLPTARIPHLSLLLLKGVNLAQTPAAVLHALHHNRSLRILNLSNTGIDLAYLPVASLPHLEVLFLNEVDFRKAPPVILDGLRQNRYLECLELNNTHLTPDLLAVFADVGAESFRISAKDNPAIKEDSFACFRDREEEMRLSALEYNWPSFDTDDRVLAQLAVLPPTNSPASGNPSPDTFAAPLAPPPAS